MAHPPMPSIELLGIGPIELPHPLRQVSLRGLDQEMIMVVHKAIGMAKPAIPIHHVPQETEPQLTIPVIADDRPASIPPCRHMVHGTGKFNS
jgi:hypothetical protein